MCPANHALECVRMLPPGTSSERNIYWLTYTAQNVNSQYSGSPATLTAAFRGEDKLIIHSGSRATFYAIFVSSSRPSIGSSEREERRYWRQIGGLIDVRCYVLEVRLISFTPRLSRRRRRSRNVPPFMYPTFAAISSTLALLVFKRCTARSTRRLWKYDIGDFPRTLCSRRVSVLLLAPTAFAALSRENPRASLARAQRSKSCTTGSECVR
jgi:hypothetical protein